MSDKLENRSCTPCQGGIPPLSEEEAHALLRRISGWKLEGGGRSIGKRFEFPDFKQALDFIVRVGQAAEEEGHHPDVAFGWGWATVSWQTKKIGGLHENDFIMASKTDNLRS